MRLRTAIVCDRPLRLSPIGRPRSRATRLRYRSTIFDSPIVATNTCVVLVQGNLLAFSVFNETSWYPSYHCHRERSAAQCRFLYPNPRTALCQALREFRRSVDLSFLFWRSDRPSGNCDYIFCLARCTPRNARNGAGDCNQLRDSTRFNRLLEIAFRTASRFL